MKCKLSQLIVYANVSFGMIDDIYLIRQNPSKVFNVLTIIADVLVGNIAISGASWKDALVR